MPRHRQRSDWPLTLGIMLLAATLSGLVVLALHHQLGVADRALDAGVRPVEPTPAITYTGPVFPAQEAHSCDTRPRHSKARAAAGTTSA